MAGGRPLLQRLVGPADFDQIGAHRFGDVLELGCAEIADLHLKPPLDLPIGVLRETDGPWLGDPFQPRGDIDCIAHDVAVALLDDVPNMNADAKLDPPFRRHPDVALDQAVLHFDGAARRVDHAAEFDDRAVASALDDAAVMGGDGGVDEIAPQRAQARKRPLLIDAGEPAESNDIGD